MDNNKITSNKLNINSNMMEKLAEREKFLAKKREAFKNNTGNIQSNVGNIQNTNPNQNYEMLKELEELRKDNKRIKNFAIGGLVLLGLTLAGTALWSNKKEQEPVPTTAIETEAPTQEYPIETEVAKSALNADNINELTQQIKNDYASKGLHMDEEEIAAGLVMANATDIYIEEMPEILEAGSLQSFDEAIRKARDGSSAIGSHNSVNNEHFASISDFFLNKTDKKIIELNEDIVNQIKDSSLPLETRKGLSEIYMNFIIGNQIEIQAGQGYLSDQTGKYTYHDASMGGQFFIERAIAPSFTQVAQDDVLIPETIIKNIKDRALNGYRYGSELGRIESECNSIDSTMTR